MKWESKVLHIQLFHPSHNRRISVFNSQGYICKQKMSNNLHNVFLLFQSSVYPCAIPMIAIFVIVSPSTWSGLPSPPPSSTQSLCSKSKKFQQRPPTGCQVTSNFLVVIVFPLLWLQLFNVSLCIVLRRYICHIVILWLVFVQQAARLVALMSVRTTIGWWHSKGRVGLPKG